MWLVFLMLRFSKLLSTRFSWGEKREGGIPIVQEMGELVEAPGHDFISLVRVAVILAASYHCLLSKAKVTALSSSLHGLG